MLTKNKAIPGLIAGTGLMLALPMAPAMAKGGSDDRVEVASEGMCSGSARWELKAKERDGGVEVEFEVDSNVVGQEWAYTLSGPGGVLSSGTRTTTGPSGSFSVEVKTGGSANDTFVGQATSGGQECTTGVNVGATDDSSDDSGDDSSDDSTSGKDPEEGPHDRDLLCGIGDHTQGAAEGQEAGGRARGRLQPLRPAVELHHLPQRQGHQVRREEDHRS